MKRLKSLLVLFLLFGLVALTDNKVDASAGRLQSASIITCNGVMYGKHTNHWHVAARRGNYYYPQGSPVAKPSCAKAKKQVKNKVSTSTYTVPKAVPNKGTASGSKKANKDKASEKQDDVEKDANKGDEVATNKKSTALVDSDSVKNPADQQINEPMELFSTVVALAVIGGGIYYFYKKKSKKGKRKR